MPNELGYVFSDVYAQGVSFKRDKWLLHITPPPTGRLSKANLLVPLSRPSLWSDLHLLQPLWPEGDMAARDKVIATVRKALIPSQDYLAEILRLEVVAAATKQRLYSHMMGPQ